jgi:hypothetical protein
MPIVYNPVDERVKAKYYSYYFTINEAGCTASYDPEKHQICFNCGSDDEESLLEFLGNLQTLIDTHAALLCIDEIELKKLALKHLKKELKINELLDEIP